MSETVKFSDRVFTAEEMDKIVAMFIKAAARPPKPEEQAPAPEGESDV